MRRRRNKRNYNSKSGKNKFNSFRTKKDKVEIREEDFAFTCINKKRKWITVKSYCKILINEFTKDCIEGETYSVMSLINVTTNKFGTTVIVTPLAPVKQDRKHTFNLEDFNCEDPWGDVNTQP